MFAAENTELIAGTKEMQIRHDASNFGASRGLVQSQELIWSFMHSGLYTFRQRFDMPAARTVAAWLTKMMVENRRKEAFEICRRLSAYRAFLMSRSHFRAMLERYPELAALPSHTEQYTEVHSRDFLDDIEILLCVRPPGLTVDINVCSFTRDRATERKMCGVICLSNYWSLQPGAEPTVIVACESKKRDLSCLHAN